MQPCAKGVPLFPRCAILAYSRSVEGFGDCFVSSIICILGVTPDGRRDSRKGVGCGKEVLNDLRNACIGRWVSRVAALASMFYTPGMRSMDAWIFA